MLRKSVSLVAPASRRAAAAACSRGIHLPSRESKDSKWGKTAEDFERVQKLFKQVSSTSRIACLHQCDRVHTA